MGRTLNEGGTNRYWILYESHCQKKEREGETRSSSSRLWEKRNRVNAAERAPGGSFAGTPAHCRDGLVRERVPNRKQEWCWRFAQRVEGKQIGPVAGRSIQRAFQLSEVRRKDENDAQSMGVLIREAFPRGSGVKEGDHHTLRAPKASDDRGFAAVPPHRIVGLGIWILAGEVQPISRLPCRNRTLNEQDQVNPDKSARAAVARRPPDQ
jgi:hypothetical protein